MPRLKKRRGRRQTTNSVNATTEKNFRQARERFEAQLLEAEQVFARSAESLEDMIATSSSPRATAQTFAHRQELVAFVRRCQRRIDALA